jgi:hypothetical protein
MIFPLLSIFIDLNGLNVLNDLNRYLFVTALRRVTL